MEYRWGMLKGELDREERKFMLYLIERGIAETQPLYEQSKSPQTRGAVEAFISFRQFNSIEEFEQFWNELNDGMEDARQADENPFYWRLRGQQAQIEFILDRILAWRVKHGRADATSLSAKAVISVVEYLQRRDAGQD